MVISLPAPRAFLFALVLITEVVALAIVQSPAERFVRYIGYDSGVDLTMQSLWTRGFRPAVDFACAYGLAPLSINRAWYAVAGLSPEAFRIEVIAGTCLIAWGLARFARAGRVGPAGLALIALAIPDVLFPSYSTIVHVLEPALLVHGLAEQARGRRANALAFATAAVFVKPAMGFVYGFCLLLAIATAARGESDRRRYWLRALAPAAALGTALALVLTALHGPGPLLGTILPTKGAAIYRIGGYGFFRGVGREFWDLRGVGVLGYFRYEVGVWLLGSLWLAWGGLSALVRLARGRSTGEAARDDEMVATCATLHVIFVTCFFGQRASWTYYFTILILGLAARAKGGRARVAVAWCLAALLLVNDGSKLRATLGDWRASSPSAETLGLWSTPAERAEWRRVLELTGDQPAVLLALIEGTVPLAPRFAAPVVAYLCPGLTLPAEIDRKARQLAAAPTIVVLVRHDWEGFTLWPELAAALDGCELAFDGATFRVYRRVRVGPQVGSRAGPVSLANREGRDAPLRLGASRRLQCTNSPPPTTDPRRRGSGPSLRLAPARKGSSDGAPPARDLRRLARPAHGPTHRLRPGAKSGPGQGESRDQAQGRRARARQGRRDS